MTMPTLDDPRVRKLDRACSRAYLDMIDAVEDAGRQGLSVTTIAWYANLPETEIRYVLKEMRERDAEGCPCDPEGLVMMCDEGRWVDRVDPATELWAAARLPSRHRPMTP